VTVIACFALHGVPLVFADLLLTGLQTGQTRPIAVPTIGDAQDFFGDSGWAVRGLRQKIAVVSPNCVIAWAGDYLGARIAISGIGERARCGHLSSDDVLTYLKQECALERHPASFVGFTLESGVVRQFGFQAEQYNSPTLGAVGCAGTGTSAIRDFSTWLQEAEWRHTKPSAVNPTLDAVARTLALGGMLLESEFRGRAAATTILNMFGGGYEIAVLESGNFRKVDDLTYVFWYARLVPGGVEIARPALIIKQRYLREHLLLRAIHVAPDPSGQELVQDDQRHSISPVCTTSWEPSIDDLSKIELQSRLFCHCVIVSEGGSLSGMYTLVENYARMEDAKMTIEDRNNQVLLNIRGDLLDTIGSTIHSKLRSATPLDEKT
jgi:hypothetical protein